MSVFSMLGGWLQQQKDASCSFLAERALQGTIQRYGRMLNLSIDSRNRSLQLEMLPKGEERPVTILVERYEVVTENQTTFLVIHKASASREWLTVLINDFLIGRRLPVPPQYEAALRLIL
jgi:hypothetical protein